MKVKFLKILVIVAFVAIGMFENVYAAKNSLEDLAKIFNECDAVARYKNLDVFMNASAQKDKLIIDTKNSEGEKKIEFTLDGSVLSISTDDISALFVTTILADCVGQLNGYEDGELFDTLNTKDIQKYTLENEGFEIKSIAEDNYEVKMDIDKKIPLVDLSKIFIEPEDLDVLQKIVESGEPGSTTGSKTKMSFSITISDSIEIYIGERNEITESTYNSILSVIEVAFGENEKNDFAKNYASIKDGNKEFGKYKVEVDIIGSDVSLQENAKVTKVTINDTTVKQSNIVTTIDEPTIGATDNNNNAILYIIIGAVTCIVIVLVVIVIRKKK